MRHRKKGKKLGRESGHRKQTLAALSSALIENKRIQTTLAKAKALRPFVEPLITRSKEDTMHNRKQVFRHLQNKEAIKELFGEVAEQVGDRPGGYTRIIKLGQRSGDGAEMAMIELVDYNDVPPASTGGDSGSRTRRGGGKGRRKSSKKEDTAAQEETTAQEPDEEAATAEAQDTEEETTTAEAQDTATDVEAPEEEETATDEAAEAEDGAEADEAAEPTAEAADSEAEDSEAVDDTDEDKEDKS